MFKHIEIRLSSPLCKCEINKLAWGIIIDNGEWPCLYIYCRECKVRMIIPKGQFVAVFKLDIPYPGQKPEGKITIMDGGKVIPLHKDEHEE